MLFVVTPTVGWALPLVWPAVMAAAGALGYEAFTSTSDDAILRGKLSRQMSSQRIVKVPLDRVMADIIAEEVGREEVLRFQRDGVTLIFKRDARGKFGIDIMGPDARTARDLESEGLQFAETLVQQFALNKIVVEMEQRSANVVEEESVSEEGDIVIKLRRWV